MPIPPITSLTEQQVTPDMQDWSSPSCSKCFYRWLHDNAEPGREDERACPGLTTMCLRYYPPLKPEVAAESMAAAFTAALTLLGSGCGDPNCENCGPRFHKDEGDSDGEEN